MTRELNHRHPLTLRDAIGEATVNVAERLRETRRAPSWPTCLDMAENCRDTLTEISRQVGSDLGRVPAGLQAIADVYARLRDPELP